MELQKIREPQLLGVWRRAAAKSKVHGHRFAQKLHPRSLDCENTSRNEFKLFCYNIQRYWVSPIAGSEIYGTWTFNMRYLSE